MKTKSCKSNEKICNIDPTKVGKQFFHSSLIWYAPGSLIFCLTILHYISFIWYIPGSLISHFCCLFDPDGRRNDELWLFVAGIAQFGIPEKIVRLFNQIFDYSIIFSIIPSYFRLFYHIFDYIFDYSIIFSIIQSFFDHLFNTFGSLFNIFSSSIKFSFNQS
jgi:hypothetical protein